MEQAISLIKQLASDRFYGSLTVKFENGEVVFLRKEETIKPQNCRNNRGDKSIEHEHV
jgi:hypothetical protein